MAKINLLTPEEQARKTREMQLDVNKANKELTKPDTSQWDTRILADQTKLDNMAPLDTSTWDDNIANAQSALEKKQDEDPSAGLKGEITALQDAMSNLNTDAFDEKINAIKDKLSQPAPDTTGLTNQLAGLNAQLAGGTISQSQFNAQYGATALKKQSVLTQYQSDTSGLQGQLKLLTQERNDQALANKETAQADRQRIIDLTAQVKVKDAAHKKDLADLQDYIKAQEAARTKATKDDAAARKLLTDDIKKEGNDRANALAPYNAEMKKITDEQAHLAALDAAASAARTLALAPYKQKLEEANQAKQDGLRPLDEEKTRLDDIKMKLSEQKAAQENIKQEAEANAQQLKDAAANAGTANDNLDKTPGKVKSIGDALGHIGDKLPGPDSPFVQFIDKLREKLENIKKIIDDDVVPALGRFASFIEDHVLDPLGKFYDWLEPKIITGLGDLRDIINNGVVPRLQDFYHWIAEQITPSLEHYYDTIANHVIPTQLNFAGTLGSIVTPAVGALFDIISKSATPALTTFGDYVDQILAPVLKNFVNLALEPVRLAFDAEQLLLNNFVKPAIHDVGVVMGTEVQPIVDKFGEAFGKFNKVLSNLKDWIDKNWGGVGNALMSPFKIAFTPIANFFENLHKGINWLGQHFKLPTIDPPPISQDLSAGTGAGQAPGNNAQGTKDWRGGLSWVGETGPELMYVPQHAVIVPNQQSRAMMGAGGVPGFADGLNLDFLDNALSALGGVVKGAAGGLVDKLMNALGVPDIPGLPDAGKALVDSVKSGILDWIKGSPVEGEALGRSFATGGFNDMALKDFLAYMSSYGGPVDSEGAFNDLISVGKERGVDPRWLMAIMQTESAYGNTAGKLAPFWNFGGMEMSGRADFDSGQKATDSGADFAGYNNLKDFLEDIAQWIQQNGTSFVSYDGSGVDKNNTYQQLVQSIPIVGGAAQGGAGNNDVLADAIKYLGSRAFLDANGMTYCEGFLDTIRQDFGFARKGYGSAIEHATAVLGQLQGGPAPAGDEGFFANVRGATGWSQYGHTGVAVGDGTYISALGSGITHNQGDWESNPGYLGHGPISLAAGGYFPGNDGHLALIGEGPPEVASPVSVMEQVVRNNASNGGDINIAQGAIVINAPPGVDGRQYGQDFGNGFLTTMRTKGMVVSQR
jgi:dihydroneopterin aldolase